MDDASRNCDDEQEGSSVYSAETVRCAVCAQVFQPKLIRSLSIWNIKASLDRGQPFISTSNTNQVLDPFYQSVHSRACSGL